MKITLELDDKELRRVLEPWIVREETAAADPPGKLLTVVDVAERLRVSRSKAYSLPMAGEVDSVKIGRNRRVDPAALTKFISRAGRTHERAW